MHKYGGHGQAFCEHEALCASCSWDQLCHKGCSTEELGLQNVLAPSTPGAYERHEAALISS